MGNLKLPNNVDMMADITMTPFRATACLIMLLLTPVLALAEDAAAIIELAGGRVDLHAASGTALEPGAPILTAHGPASALLRGWKVAQTLIEVWSGVATDARAIVDAATAVAPAITIACTRKNVPGTKRFAVAAVKAGGAVMRRLVVRDGTGVSGSSRVPWR